MKVIGPYPAMQRVLGLCLPIGIKKRRYILPGKILEILS